MLNHRDVRDLSSHVRTTWKFYTLHISSVSHCCVWAGLRCIKGSESSACFWNQTKSCVLRRGIIIDAMLTKRKIKLMFCWRGPCARLSTGKERVYYLTCNQKFLFQNALPLFKIVIIAERNLTKQIQRAINYLSYTFKDTLSIKMSAEKSWPYNLRNEDWQIWG